MKKKGLKAKIKVVKVIKVDPTKQIVELEVESPEFLPEPPTEPIDLNEEILKPADANGWALWWSSLWR